MTKRMEELDCSIEEEAKQYITHFKNLHNAFVSRYGQIGKSFKPFPITYPWAYPKLTEAKKTLQLLEGK